MLSLFPESIIENGCKKTRTQALDRKILLIQYKPLVCSTSMNNMRMFGLFSIYSFPHAHRSNSSIHVLDKEYAQKCSFLHLNSHNSMYSLFIPKFKIYTLLIMSCMRTHLSLVFHSFFSTNPADPLSRIF